MVLSSAVRQNFYWLDLIRGLSALAVFSGHLRVICFKDYSVKELPLLGKFIFFITGFGHEAVIIFFVMSGFFIIKSIHESYIKKTWSITAYASNRIVRLWIVLIPALIIGFILDKLGLKYFSDSLIYSNKIRYFAADIDYKLGYSIFLGNVFFLQTVFVPTFGSNGSLWSLANEFWYYTVFPLFYFGMVKKYNLISRFILVLLGIFLLFLIGGKISIFFIIWLMGGFSYFLTKIKINIFKSNVFCIIMVFAFLLILFVIRIKQFSFYFNDYTLALIFSILIPVLTNKLMRSNYLKIISNYLSDVSYTLYLVHLPFNFFITSCFYFQNKTWSINNLFKFLVFVSITMLYATIMWYLFERNTPFVKSFAKLLNK